MLKKILLGFLGLLVLVVAIGWFTIGDDFRYANQAFGRESAAADYALQDDSKVDAPAPEPLVEKVADWAERTAEIGGIG